MTKENVFEEAAKEKAEKAEKVDKVDALLEKEVKAPKTTKAVKSVPKEVIDNTEEMPEPTNKKVNADSESIAKFKTRLDVLNVKYSEDATMEELIQLYKDKMESLSTTVKPDEVEDLIREYNRKQAQRLVRVSISCMNNAKTDLKGQWFTIRNRTIGVMREFVPYNTDAMAAGWHIPLAMYKNLRERVYYPAITKKGKHGIDEVAGTAQKEFNIVVLEPLTQDEIDEIAKHQRANNTIKRD